MKYQRLINSGKGSFFLFGPRGTGKSTWLHDMSPDALYIDLLREDIKTRLEARPERLAEMIDATPNTSTIVIDEVQRVSALLPVVHRLIERDSNARRYILTGSSARKLKRSGVDLLSGRAVIHAEGKAPSRRTRQVYFFDTGVFRAIRPKGPLDLPAEIDGAALEGLVFQQLRTWIDYRATGETLSFWRTHTGQEVDFVIYGEDRFDAIEVKNAARLSPKDFSGLKAFATDYPEARRILLYRGTEKLLRNDVLCIPVEEFLRTLTI